VSTQRKKREFTVCMLASGSRGNSIYISDGDTAILFDAGLSGIQIEKRLASRGLDPEALTGIVVSHEHSDHIQGVGVLARRYGLPVYINQKTMSAAAAQLGKIQTIMNFECGSPFNIGSLTIHPFSLSHDAEDPAGFTVQRNSTKIGIATDLGTATAMVTEHLKGCALLVLEANHDPHMLTTGPYPWPLKQRIKGRTGHLSNEEAKGLVKAIHHDRLAHIVLAHLSEVNNAPDHAVIEIREVINLEKTCLTVAEQDNAGELLFV
jgi:phosphoribosyl 1,2-cyclic phosphodiesterase